MIHLSFELIKRINGEYTLIIGLFLARTGLINTGRRQKSHEKQGLTTTYETASN